MAASAPEMGRALAMQGRQRAAGGRSDVSTSSQLHVPFSKARRQNESIWDSVGSSGRRSISATMARRARSINCRSPDASSASCWAGSSMPSRPASASSRHRPSQEPSAASFSASTRESSIADASIEAQSGAAGGITSSAGLRRPGATAGKRRCARWTRAALRSRRRSASARHRSPRSRHLEDERGELTPADEQIGLPRMVLVPRQR